MKKPKRKKSGDKIYEFTDYAGVKVITTHVAWAQVIGSPEPDTLMLDIITSIVADPDFVFASHQDWRNHPCYFKSIGGIDYVLEAGVGSGAYGLENFMKYRHIKALRGFEANDETKRALVVNSRLLDVRPKFFSYSANFYPN